MSHLPASHFRSRGQHSCLVILTRAALTLSVGTLSVGALSACDEPTPAASKPIESAELKLEAVASNVEAEVEREKEAPQFSIDESSVKITHSRYLIDRPDGLSKLRAQLEAQKAHIQGKELTLEIARQAKLPWVTALLSELQTAGAVAFEIKTPTRSEYPEQVTFTASTEIGDLPSCTPVSAIQADRTTVTWKQGGGAQSRRGRGLGGPDLSTTGLSIARLAKACPTGNSVLLGAHEAVDWGLVYDLAASTSRIEDTTFERRVLLLKEPKPGKRVEL